MATGYITARHESIPGNETNSPTPSTKRWYFPATSFTPSPNPAHMERDDEIRNLDEPIARLPERYGPEWAMECRMYPDIVAFYLILALGLPTSTAGDGVITDPDTTAIPVGATRHVWTAPFGPSGASPLTAYFQAAYRDQSVFFDIEGAALSEMSIATPETGGAMLSGSGPALYMPVASVSDPALTPSYESLAITPFQRSHLTLPTWLASTAASTEDFSLTISNPVEPYASLGIASKFPDVMEKGEAPIMFTGSIPKRRLDADDYAALMAATGFSAVARWVSTSIIASGYPYKLYVAMDNCQYVAGGPGALENKRRIGGSFDFAATSDGAGASVTVTLVNATASYA